MRRLYASSVVLLIQGTLGCAGPTHWEHPGKGEAEYHRDSIYCDQRAQMMAGSVHSGIDTSLQQARSRAVCLQELGWRPAR